MSGVRVLPPGLDTAESVLVQRPKARFLSEMIGPRVAENTRTLRLHGLFVWIMIGSKWQKLFVNLIHLR